MSITNISRVNTIDEWRIQTNESANALNTLETGAYEKTAGSLTIKNDASLVITSNGTALQVSNAAQFSTNVTIGKDLYLGARETATGNLTVGKEVVIQGSGNALTVANNATVNNNLQVTKTITTNNVTVNTNVNVTGTTQTGSLIIDSGGIVGTTLVVTGNLTGGNVTTTGATDTGRLSVTNGATVGTTLGVTGNITGGNVTTAGATDTGRLQVTNGATVGTTLGVTGNTTSGNLTTAGATDTGRLQVTNGATVGTTLSVTGNVSGGNLTTSAVVAAAVGRISETLSVTGNTTSGNLTTTGATDTGRLAVTNGATVGASLSVGTTLSVTGNASASNLNTAGVVSSETLRVNSSGTVGTTLDVTGNTTTGNLNTSGVTNTATLRVNSSATIGTTLGVTGNITGGNVTTTGATDTGRLSVTNGATVGTTLGVTGNITGGNVTTTGATDTGRLQVTNGATIGSTLSVASSATISTTLGVTGNITGGNVTTTGATDTGRLQVTNGATVGSSLSVGTTLSVTGNTTSGNLTTTGATDTGRLQVTNGATVGGALTVTGAATIGGDLQITGSTIYLGPTLNDTDSIILRGLTRQTPSSGYDYFSVNRTKMPVTLNVTTNTVNTSVAHAFSNGQNVVLSSIVGTTNINPGSTYRVLNFSGTTSFFLTTNYGAGNTVVDLTGVNGTATVTDSDNYDAQFRWDEANKIWDIRNTTDGTYSKVLLRSDLSDSTISTSTIIPASLAAVNTVNTRVGSLSATSPIVRTGDTFSHATSGVTASGYGDSISIPVFVVNSTGHVTSVTNTTVRSATTSQTGVTQLTDSTSSTSTTTAATPNSVKTTYDAIGTANTAMKSYVDNKFAPLAGAAFTGDVSVSGNLTVTGQTTYMNTNTLNIGDNILTLNADLPSGTAPTENAGIEVNRGSSTNVYVRWDESIDSWVANNGITANEYRLANTTTYLTEGTNLYFTAARVRGNVSAASPITYNSTSGEFGHSTSGVTAATYANATHVPVITVNATGHVTGITNTAISYPTPPSDFGNVTASNSKSSYTWTANSGSAVADTTSDTLTVVGGDNIIVSSNTNLDAILIEHADTSALSGKQGSAGIKSVTVDGAGHVTSVETETYLVGESDTLSTVTGRGAATSDAISITNTTKTTSNSTGALKVSGGAGFKGNVWADALYDNGFRVVTQVGTTAGTPLSSTQSGTTFGISHDDSGVTAKTYANSTFVPVITVNATGHVTSITNTAISFPAEADTLATVTGRGATTSSVVSFTSDTESTSTTTGTVKITGGLGVTRNVTATAVYSKTAIFGDSTTGTSPPIISRVSSESSGFAATFDQQSTGNNFVVFSRGSTSANTRYIGWMGNNFGIFSANNFLGLDSTPIISIGQVGTQTNKSVTFGGGIYANTNSSTVSITGIINATGTGHGQTLQLLNRGSGSANCYMTFRADSTSIGNEYQFGVLSSKFALWDTPSSIVFDVDSSKITTFYADVRSTGSFTAGYSDDRLKDKHGNIPNALEKVSAINGFYYTANETAKDLGMSDGMQVGVSSQEVEKIMPEVVVPSALDGYNTVHYEKLVPLLIEAIKELKAEVDELKKNK